MTVRMRECQCVQVGGKVSSWLGGLQASGQVDVGVSVRMRVCLSASARESSSYASISSRYESRSLLSLAGHDQLIKALGAASASCFHAWMGAFSARKIPQHKCPAAAIDKFPRLSSAPPLSRLKALLVNIVDKESSNSIIHFVSPALARSLFRLQRLLSFERSFSYFPSAYVALSPYMQNSSVNVYACVGVCT